MLNQFTVGQTFRHINGNPNEVWEVIEVKDWTHPHEGTQEQTTKVQLVGSNTVVGDMWLRRVAHLTQEA